MLFPKEIEGLPTLLLGFALLIGFTAILQIVIWIRNGSRKGGILLLFMAFLILFFSSALMTSAYILGLLLAVGGAIIGAIGASIIVIGPPRGT